MMYILVRLELYANDLNPNDLTLLGIVMLDIRAIF